MSSISSARSDFITALQSGLDAYDAGNTVEAARRFDEAVAIDPQNVWGLLWKGATAASPAESREWLLKVLTIEPDNEHAQAGLMWLDQTGPGDAAAAKAIVAAATLGEGEHTLPSELSSQATPRGGQDEGPGELPSWFLGTPDPGSEEATLPGWLRGLDEPELPTHEKPAVAAASASFDDTPLPAWLRGEQMTASDVPAATAEAVTRAQSISLPDWLRGEDETAEAAEGAQEDEVQLPAWLVEDVPEEEDTAAPVPEAHAAEPAVADEDEAFPAWLHDDAMMGTTAGTSAPDQEDPFRSAEQLDDEPATSVDRAAATLLNQQAMDDELTLPPWLRGEEEQQEAPTAWRDGVTGREGDAIDTALAEETAPTTAGDTEDQGEEYPVWLRAAPVDSGAPLTAEDESVLPDWLRGETEVSVRGDAVDEPEWPDWIAEDFTEEAGPDDTGRLPGWVPDEPRAAAEDEQKAMATTPSGEVRVWLEGKAEASASIVDPSMLSYAEYQTLYQSGLEAYEQDRLEEAIDAFEQVAAVEGDNVELYNYLGSAYFLADKPQQAIQAFEHAIATDPAYTESYLNLGLVYKETGETERAVELFERYLDHEQDDESTVGYVREILEEMR